MSPEQELLLTQTLEAAVKAYLGNDQTFEFDLKTIELRIRISGKGWSGIVDKPVAKFLIDLDQKLTQELIRLDLPVPSTPHGLVALKIEEGSLDAYLKYAQPILDQVSKMTPGQQIALVCVILSAYGISKIPAIIEALQKGKIEKTRSDERVQLVKAVTSIVESRDIQQPLRGLLKNMTPEDRIDLPGFEPRATKQQIVETLAKSERSKPTRYYVDHRYEIHDLSTKNPDEWGTLISFGDVSFRAKLLLSNAEIVSLLNEFTEAHKKNSTIAPDMQVTAMINDKGVRSAEVVGLGQPRANSTKLSEALAIEAGKKLDKIAILEDEE